MMTPDAKVMRVYCSGQDQPTTGVDRATLMLIAIALKFLLLNAPLFILNIAEMIDASLPMNTMFTRLVLTV